MSSLSLQVCSARALFQSPVYQVSLHEDAHSHPDLPFPGSFPLKANLSVTSQRIAWPVMVMSLAISDLFVFIFMHIRWLL
ncbi:unnamed protein product [Protopolystoma xenopodis]|uniref:Uncharacterized protein n=1 Tax=Protopolystoma xenopodis TaxID=117903 RepID=A0A448XEM1_9PLAT|nr:unnamed protein product [Protopolystoma xenopodis]